MAVIKFQKNSSIQIAILIELSHAMKHNFVRDVADLLPPEYGWSKAPDLTHENRIAELEEENKILRAERLCCLKR